MSEFLRNYTAEVSSQTDVHVPARALERDEHEPLLRRLAHARGLSAVAPRINELDGSLPPAVQSVLCNVLGMAVDVESFSNAQDILLITEQRTNPDGTAVQQLLIGGANIPTDDLDLYRTSAVNRANSDLEQVGLPYRFDV